MDRNRICQAGRHSGPAQQIGFDTARIDNSSEFASILAPHRPHAASAKGKEMSKDTPVPQPPLKPVFGNPGVIDTDKPIQSLMALAREYGPFYKIRIPQHEF